MAMTADQLPDDPDVLKAMVLARDVENARLTQIIKELQRHRFGRRATASWRKRLPQTRQRDANSARGLYDRRRLSGAVAQDTCRVRRIAVISHGVTSAVKATSRRFASTTCGRNNLASTKASVRRIQSVFLCAFRGVLMKRAKNGTVPSDRQGAISGDDFEPELGRGIPGRLLSVRHVGEYYYTSPFGLKGAALIASFMDGWEEDVSLRHFRLRPCKYP
ncbi:hypothetical protein [Mesorhizobium silamurunense]|uniref:hypothetical protein n=1 Tax=Mesorhizobium silamurunense TaxID=499528 RepID=UPI00177E3A1E|nr:hypothetical protein [Mesorhizobium silamurunense]